MYWSPTSFGVNQEAFVTLSNVDTAGTEQDLLFKVQGGTPNWANGVIEVSYDAATHQVVVWTYRPDRPNWQSYTAISVTYQNGDRFGARVLSNGQIQIYRNCILIGTITLDSGDRTFFNSKGGRIGVWYLGAGNAYFDDFGGGTLP